MKIKFRLLGIGCFLFATGLFSACQKDDPEVEKTNTVAMAGDWWVTYKVARPNGQFVDTFGVGYTRLSTFNTSDNTSDQMWVTDNGTFWTYQVKANVDLGNKSFSATDVKSVSKDTHGDPYDIKVNIMNGHIIENGGRSTGGNQVDSIAFMVKFEDDPDNMTFLVSGHKRTGFLEDEH